MNALPSHVPPGFRFHPTDEELVDYYLRKKIASKRIDLDIIKEVDLYRIEPWDLQEKCGIQVEAEEQCEWYFFSHKDRKYPTGTRTNRATAAGFWKATGRDKPIYTRQQQQQQQQPQQLVGMRKTLVFYRGRAPNGQKLDWIMHEYRLETSENGPPQEEGWVVCKVFKKKMTMAQRASCEQELPYSYWYDVDVCNQLPFYSCKQEMELQYQHCRLPPQAFLPLPGLESTGFNQDKVDVQSSSGRQAAESAAQLMCGGDDGAAGQAAATDWRVLDKFVASQLSHDGVAKEGSFPGPEDDGEQEGVAAAGYASTSTSSCRIDLWK